MKKTAILTSTFLVALACFSQEQKNGVGTIEFLSPKLSKLIKKDAKIEILADGFQFTEGPLWIAKENMLLFSDIPANTIYKWTAVKGKEVYLQNAGYTDTAKRGGFMGPNGLALSRDNRLLICQHGDRRIAKMDAPLDAPQNKLVTFAGTYQGKRFNSPNDLCFSKNGDVYFTDPWYGLEKGMTDPKKEISYQGLYKMDNSGNVTMLIDSLDNPNGIAIFPDGKTLLVSNSDARKKVWYKYTIGPEGTLSNGRIFFDVSNEKGSDVCDGLKIDSKGNVFATGPGGIWIFTSKAELIGKINIDGVSVANCTFSPDEKTIYLTATNFLLRVKMR